LLEFDKRLGFDHGVTSDSMYLTDMHENAHG